MTEVSLGTTAVRNRDDPPVELSRAHFLVVFAGDDEVGLHNVVENRFIRMNGPAFAQPSPSTNANSPVWTADRFKMLRCGSGEICFHNSLYNTFLTMRPDPLPFGLIGGTAELGPAMHFALVEVPGNAGFITLSDQACKGVPYTHSPCYTECRGWMLSSMDECWQKCVTNAFPEGCVGITDNSECVAAVFESNGQCHLYDGQCTQLSTDSGTTTRLKKFEANFKLVEGQRCTNAPFTDNAGIDCKGFEHVTTADECKQKCMESAHAPNCPHKPCAAAMFWEDTQVCHFYDACESWTEASDGRPGKAIVQKNLFKHLHGVKCSSTPYTQQAGCNGFQGVSAAQCQAFCERSDSPCGVAGTCRAATYNEDTEECQLHDECGTQTAVENYVSMISVLPATYRNFKFYNGKRCSTSPYTYDLGADPPCNGFHNMNEYECQAACENSNVASGCPEKLCVASVFYPSTKECHLYESCPSLVDDANARTIRAAATSQPASLITKEAEVEVPEESDLGPYHELATALPSVLMNLTNYSGLIRNQNRSNLNMAHRFGDPKKDIELLYEMFEGFFRALNTSLDTDGPLVCPHRSYAHISACISMAACVLQSAVPTHIDMEYFSSIMELEMRFQDISWPIIRQGLMEEALDFSVPDELLSKYRCDEFVEVGAYEPANNESFLQLDNLEGKAKTLALSSAMLHATRVSHRILDAHGQNTTMESTLQQLEETWYPVCRHLFCDHTNFWDIHMASYKQTRALLQTSAVAHLRSEIQSRYKLEQRMQRFVSAHQDKALVERFWRNHNRAHDESLHLYGQQGRKAVLRVVESFSTRNLEKALQLFDREVLQEHIEDHSDDSEGLLTEGSFQSKFDTSVSASKWRWLKAIFKALKCFGQTSFFVATGYWNPFHPNVGWSYALSAGSFSHFGMMARGEPHPDENFFMSLSLGLIAGVANEFYAAGVSASVSLSVGCGASWTVSLGVGAWGAAIVKAPWLPTCILGAKVPPGCVSGMGLCASCCKSMGVSFSLLCCSWNVKTKEHTCR
ncbi:unnamed protein product [Durusdinium trenchii]